MSRESEDRYPMLSSVRHPSMSEPDEHEEALVAHPDASESSFAASSFGATVINMINNIVGAGVLSLPWAMAQSGWIGGSVLLLLIAFFSTISMILLIRASTVTSLWTYPDLADLLTLLPARFRRRESIDSTYSGHAQSAKPHDVSVNYTEFYADTGSGAVSAGSESLPPLPVLPARPSRVPTTVVALCMLWYTFGVLLLYTVSLGELLRCILEVLKPHSTDAWYLHDGAIKIYAGVFFFFLSCFRSFKHLGPTSLFAFLLIIYTAILMLVRYFAPYSIANPAAPAHAPPSPAAATLSHGLGGGHDGASDFLFTQSEGRGRGGDAASLSWGTAVVAGAAPVSPPPARIHVENQNPSLMLSVGLLRAAPAVSLSFCMHYNVPTFYQQLAKRSLRRMYQVLACVVATVVAIYFAVAMVGFATWGLKTSDIVVLLYMAPPQWALNTFNRAATGVSAAASVPAAAANATALSRAASALVPHPMRIGLQGVPVGAPHVLSSGMPVAEAQGPAGTMEALGGTLGLAKGSLLGRDVPIDVAVFGIVLHFVFVYPLIAIACRTALYRFCGVVAGVIRDASSGAKEDYLAIPKTGYGAIGGSGGGRGEGGRGALGVAMRVVEAMRHFEARHDLVTNILATLFIVGMCVAVASAVECVAVVLVFNGAVCGVFLVYVFPALVALSVERTRTPQVAAVALLAFGLVIAVGGVILEVINLAKHGASSSCQGVCADVSMPANTPTPVTATPVTPTAWP
eukprot:TRINITY_DN55703_c0_g1_i1.p1 TRINITY_DN55703_c0_g1~~TRINITY_DN55703_c0_g1_i1.p1  ORF type:complete len:743 (-),score=157.16 TRINITY_DN55703_c0_g1_i1:370-2598(-)